MDSEKKKYYENATNKLLAQLDTMKMSDEERKNRNDGHTSATKLFISWYKDEYLKQKKKRI